MKAILQESKEYGWAKLNISLDVADKRPDGYHDMVMVMQTISLGDTVSIRLNESGRVRAKSNFSFIPGDERNLAVKAALKFLSAIGEEGQGMSIVIDKKIPVGAGMAGGSTDAAAVLRALNRMYGDPLSGAQLEELSAAVGSDVAFCVRGGTCLATGRGEKLESLRDFPDCLYVVCKPEFSISTPELFRKLDQMSLRCHPDTVGILEAVEQGNLEQVCRRMYNVFEDVDDRRLRTVKDIKSIMLDHGAMGAMMTGTGSAVFGIFRSGSDVEELVNQLRSAYGFCRTAENVSRLI